MQRCLPILLLAVLRLTRGFDLAAYKQQYQTGVGASYKIALTFAADDIIDYLAVSPVPPNAENVSHFSNILYEKTQVFSSKLDATSQSSDELLEQLYDEIEQLASQESGVEQQIAANGQCLQATSASIQGINPGLTAAQNELARVQTILTSALNTVTQEQRKVDEASKQCTYIGFCLEYKICGVVSHEDVNRAQRARDRAQYNFNRQQQRLTSIQTQQAQYVASQTKLQQSKATFDSNKANLNVQLNQLNQALNNIVSVDTTLKALIMHLDTLLGTRVVLGEMVKNLIDTETVVKPLTAIADQIVSFTSNADDVAYTNSIKQKISASVVAVQQKLSQYAVIPLSSIG